MMSKKLKITLGMVASSWGSLGFYRGVKDFEYACKVTFRDHYERLEEEQKSCYMYSHDIERYIKGFGAGLFGAFVYLIPVVWDSIIPREIYRLEVCWRDLDSEKETKRYNCIF